MSDLSCLCRFSYRYSRPVDPLKYMLVFNKVRISHCVECFGYLYSKSSIDHTCIWEYFQPSVFWGHQKIKNMFVNWTKFSLMHGRCYDKLRSVNIFYNKNRLKSQVFWCRFTYGYECWIKRGEFIILVCSFCYYIFSLPIFVTCICPGLAI